jgi:hypothetical protein
LTDYKRMVSYMYQYEDGLKKKNVGFVKVEAKGGQCKLTLHMQLLGQLDSIFPTYMILRGKQGVELIYLGDTVLKNQVMDSKLSADENNVMGSGFALTNMSGIMIFLNESVFFATIWDDKPIVTQEVHTALRRGKNRQEDQRQEDKRQEAVAKRMEPDQEPDTTKERSIRLSAEFERNTMSMKDAHQEQLQAELNTPRYMLPGGYKMVERLQWQSMETAKQEAGYIEDIQGEALINTEQLVEEKESEVEPWNQGALNREYDKEGQEQLFQIIEEMNAAELKAVQQLNANQTVSAVSSDPPAAKHFFDNYPRIYPFEDNEITQCVKIEPKDIGLLPKELWPYCNNSFLMHGYYCYHHLVFAKMKNGYGYFYILGIPGLYHGREQFMARMFGFESFKSIKKRELRQGDFGYWYLPITL